MWATHFVQFIIIFTNRQMENNEFFLFFFKSVCSFFFIFFYIMFAVMSENYIVFIEQPIKLDLLKFMLYRVAGKSFHKVMSWNPELETIFHVADRHTGQARQNHIIITVYFSHFMSNIHVFIHTAHQDKILQQCYVHTAPD